MRVNKYLTPLPLGGLGWALGGGRRGVLLCDIV